MGLLTKTKAGEPQGFPLSAYAPLRQMVDQSGLRRLWVGEFGEGVSKEDICNLIGKVCPVVESYAPGSTATGVIRRFVIVVVRCDEAQLQKCVKAFN